VFVSISQVWSGRCVEAGGGNGRTGGPTNSVPFGRRRRNDEVRGLAAAGLAVRDGWRRGRADVWRGDQVVVLAKDEIGEPLERRSGRCRPGLDRAHGVDRLLDGVPFLARVDVDDGLPERQVIAARVEVAGHLLHVVIGQLTTGRGRVE
jgi:hypothetical protein